MRTRINWSDLRYRFLHLLLAFCLFQPLRAQVDRAGLNGTVTDPSGRVIPGVHVIAVQNDTGLRREAVCSAEGSYDIPELPVGAYTVTFSGNGFVDLSFDDVVQTTGQTRTLNATLKISGSSQHVEVSASSEQLDGTSDALGTRIEKEQVKELPLNGRNWSTLTALVPGAVDTGGSNQRSVRFAGRGRDDDNFTYDGIDATNIINQGQQPYVRLAIPLDTIQEFRISSMLATAEAGATGGPQLAVASPSGTNQIHGDLFEFLRNDAVDAQQPVPAPPPGTKVPFELNQFGGSFGGPITSNKTFFFVAYEGYRQDLGQTLEGLVPSNAFRSQVGAESPALDAILNAYPEGQLPSPSGDPNAAEWVGQGKQIVQEDSGMFRVDHHFSDRTTGFVRANIDEAFSSTPLLGDSGQYLADQQQLTSRPVNSVIELLHMFSPTLLNEVKFGFNRSTADTTNVNQTGSLYAISLSPYFTNLNNNNVKIGVGNSFSGIDNMTWVKGRHTVKAGVEIRRVQLNQGSSSTGTVTFASEAAFAADQVSTASLKGAEPVNGLRKTQYYGYLQDEFRWFPNLTLNLGARYSFFNLFHEVHGKADPFDFATCGPQGFCGVGASFGQPTYGDVDPRIALAWAPRNNWRTVVRAGFGIYHEDGQLDDQNLPIGNEVYNYSLSNSTIHNLNYPINPFLAETTGILSANDEDRQRKDTGVNQWGLSVQGTLPAGFVGTVAYVGSEGHHLLTLSEVNVINPLTGTRPYPAFGQVAWRGNIANSDYNALSLSAKRTFANGFLVSANYQWSHEIDDGSDGSGDGDSIVPENVACQQCERADGAFDVRQVFNVNAVYELPFGPGKQHLSQPGLLRDVAGSWELTSIFMVRTGFPVNVTMTRSSSTVPDGDSSNSDQRPNLVPGVSFIPPGGSNPNEWINPAAFAAPAPGTFGDAPRDVARGPGSWQADLGVAKHIPLAERYQLEFRAEFFNIFNHPQFALPQAVWSTATFQPGGFGSINSTLNVGPVGTGTPREIQLGLRLTF